MLRYHATGITAAVMLLVVGSGCGSGSKPEAPPEQNAVSELPAEEVLRIEPGPDAAERIQEALILAKKGDIIDLAEGRYEFESTLSLGVPQVTIRGAGMDKTILNFSKLRGGTGGEGVSITAGGGTIHDLAIEDVPSDGLKISTIAGKVTVRRVRVEWTAGSSTKNGGYGIYPVNSNKILVEECVVRGASDAGIYVGQSTDVIVRRNRVEGNVSGIEIENCLRADVYDNDATGNTGGILVFSLPGLPLGEGSICRVYDNRIVANNHENFAAEGNIVGLVPSGTGVMIMAYDQVEVFDNTIADNQTVNLALLSYYVTEYPWYDASYIPYCQAIHIHDNTFTGGGDKPAGSPWQALSVFVGGHYPDIAYDGIFDHTWLEDGQLSDAVRISIHDNGDADFANLDLENFDLAALKLPKVRRDLAPHVRPLEPLPAVTWEGLE